MFIQREYRDAIYKLLFQEGVMIAENSNQKMHKELKRLTNLQVIKVMKSLTTRGYVMEQLAWRHFYWCLNNKGIEYLRGYLHLPPEVVPSTLKRQRRQEPARMSLVGATMRTEGFVKYDDRVAYRRYDGSLTDADKKGNVGAGTVGIVFRGGFGRGKKPT